MDSLGSSADLWCWIDSLLEHGMTHGIGELFAGDIESDEDDESPSSSYTLSEIRETVVFGADWTVGTILEQLRSGSVNLAPRYQRRDAWDIHTKSRFLESLILGLPIPQIVLAEDRAEPGRFIVLDGKQRLTTLLQFVGGLDGSRNNAFSLRGLPILHHLNGRSWASLQSDPAREGECRQFINQPVRSTVIRNWKSDAFLHLLFHRLNSNSVALSAQELRQAIIPGDFLPYLEEKSAGSLQLQRVLRITEPDFRMRDAELLLRLEAFAHFLPSYRGDLQLFLDDVARSINGDWPASRPKFDDDVSRFEEAIDLWSVAVGQDNVGRKYFGGRVQGRLNKAVLDAQVVGIEHSEARESLRQNPERAKQGFERLCRDDQFFLRSIEQTTKRLDAVHYRIEAVESMLTTGV